MGGINCPPSTDVPDLGNYIASLAAYCGPFFAGVGDFNHTNADIETTVAEGMSEADLARICDQVVRARSRLAIARTKFGSFIAAFPAEAKSIDPEAFIATLGAIIEGLDAVLIELDALSIGEKGLQTALWEDGVAAAMTAAAGHILMAQQMQLAFATAGARIGV